jgi:hypothetical protein
MTEIFPLTNNRELLRFLERSLTHILYVYENMNFDCERRVLPLLNCWSLILIGIN